ncbi:hypothetical protein F5141DRAFT_1060028 [Pisolithus sp. B1]|nr:hypothetical protein F5141DRAFT_1060028 [Pisolithus sp. B1]
MPPSPVLPKKHLAGSKKSFGFYDGRDFLQPPFTQPDRLSPGHHSSEQEEDGGIEGITKGVADLGVVWGASSHSETVLKDGSAEESDDLRRKRTCGLLGPHAPVLQSCCLPTNEQLQQANDVTTPPIFKLVMILKPFVAPVWQTIPKPNLCKHLATSPVTFQRKAAKNPSTIASHSCGSGAIPASFQQVLEAQDSMDPEAPHDVLLDHHCHNATKSKTDSTMGPLATAADADDEIQYPATAKPHTGNNNDPTTLNKYTYIGKKAFEFIMEAITELEEDGVQPDKSFLRKHQYHMSNLVVARHWDWEPDNFDGPQELAGHVLELYNHLMEEMKYIHSDHDEEGKFNNFSSVVLQDLCVTGYYIGKSLLVASFSNTFSKHFPMGALAFAVTVLTAAMDEYATGALITIEFHHEGYSKVNEQFLDIIANIEAMPHHFQSLQHVLKNIAVQGCVKNPAIGVGSANTSSGQHEFTVHLN